MKPLKIALSLGALAIAGAGVAMAVTNPSPQEYEAYAREQLSTYLREEGCPQIPELFGLMSQDRCVALIESNQGELQKIVAENTIRQNFVVFSIYRTELSLNRYLPFLPGGLVPSYEFETVGAATTFYTYSAKEQ